MSLARFDSEQGVLVVRISETEHVLAVEWSRSLADDLTRAIEHADNDYKQNGPPRGCVPHATRTEDPIGEPDFNGICTGCGRDFSDCPCAPEW